MIAAAVTTAPSAMWYLTRGTGTVALILLTLSVALGVAVARRAQTANVPRFVFDSVHRTASLLAVCFVLVHIVTAVLDGFAPITLVDAVVPFRSPYRPLWLGLGAVAFDLLVAVALTSLFRRRLGHRAWRATHWAAYASWPVALVHGLGTGSDAKSGWMLAITGACVIVVIVAVVARATAGWPAKGWPNHAGARATALAASALVPIGLLVWLPSGPLAADWAKRAGTPSSLLTAATARSPAGSKTGGGAAQASFTAPVSGTLQTGGLSGGLAEVHLALTIAGQTLSTLDIRIIGQPVGGGVDMSTSSVRLGTSSDPAQYVGEVTSLDATNVAATVRSSSGRLGLQAQLQIDPGTGTVSGTVTVGPAPGG